MKSKKLKTASILLSIILSANISYSQNQNNVTNGCPGGPCVTALGGSWAYYSKDTLTLPLTGYLTLESNYFQCCSPKIVEWYRNDTLIASGLPTYVCPSQICTALNVNKPGIYTTYFQGYYFGPGFANACAVFVLPYLSNAPLGIDETENLTELKIYPTLTENFLFIESKKEIKVISINDMNGKSVPFNFNRQEIKSKIEFDLPSGIYFIKVQVNEGVINKKIVINK